MIVHIKVLGGDGFEVQVSDESTILSLKQRIERDYGIAASRQKYVLKGKTLGDAKTIVECGITETCKVHLMVKKDSDTRPKQPPKVKTYKPNEFWDLLEKMLSSQYDNEEVGIIMQQYRTDYGRLLSTMSLDDFERIAKRNLQIGKFFVYAGKRLDEKPMVNFKSYDGTDYTTNYCNTHIANYLKKQRQPDNEM